MIRKSGHGDYGCMVEGSASGKNVIESCIGITPAAQAGNSGFQRKSFESIQKPTLAQEWEGVFADESTLVRSGVEIPCHNQSIQVFLGFLLQLLDSSDELFG